MKTGSATKNLLKRLKHGILLECFLLLLLCIGFFVKRSNSMTTLSDTSAILYKSDEPIQWVDFTVSYEALERAYEWDLATYGSDHHVNWVELLALTAAKTGGNFSSKALKTLEQIGETLSSGTKQVTDLTADLSYYDYYLEAYGSVLDGLVGVYQEVSTDETGQTTTSDMYGLKAFLPIAKGFEYSHHDDFGTGRSYGYARKHLGHDMMGRIGTPIIAVESGVVEALGWNQYGGWRIGIRSMDGRRYYYYAHMRQNYPYAEGLEHGDVVTAGDVIGYMGHTGYSATENVNNIEIIHLHWGMEVIFDEARRKDGYEIWVDVYPLTRFLAQHAQAVMKVGDTREWTRTTHINDPVLDESSSLTR
jgi:murein DD-endopeptidase MepM/ murein hydrolase activator NlpD